MAAALTAIALEDEAVHIDVLGRPAPKGSRIAAKTKSGKAYTYPASSYEKPWIEAVAEATRIVMRHTPEIEAPYEVRLTFRLRQPKQRGRALPWPRAHDVDKLARSTLDGLVRGGALKDDRHVTALTATKRYADDESDVGVHCEVRSLQAEYA